MARKTGLWVLAVLLFGPGMLPASQEVPGQDSPLKWPVPPPGPPREIVLPQILIGAGELNRALAVGAVPLDARDAGSYELGHLAGAVLAWSSAEETPWGIDRIRSLLGERGITGEEMVVLYGDPDAEAVARLFWLLRWAGCPEIRILDGGLAAWRAAGYTLEPGIFHRPRTEFRMPVGEAAAVDSGWIVDGFGQAGIELLDVRDARGWDRWQTPPTFGAGHIPYSLPFDPRSLLATGGGWPDPLELRRRLGTLGPRPGDAVPLESTFVIYGGDERDPRLGLGYLLLTLAGLEARVFAGGWREWRTDENHHPIVRVVSALELASLLNREDSGPERDRPHRAVVLVDLRDARDFAIGHLPGAFSLPYRRFTESFEQSVEDRWSGADKATLLLVFYCYGIECVRSRKAAAQASRLGFRDVLWFRGGVREWRDAGLLLRMTTAPEERASPGAEGAHP
jgi:thiosulfate/3-mercaptopyruvate sulfurtransferase